MMSPEAAAIAFGLLSGVCWGSGDFAGGVATRRSGVYGVVIATQVIGLIVYAGLALIQSTPISVMGDLMWGVLSGVSGVIGLAALYQALSSSKMGVVAPVAALVTAIVPVIASAILEGLPGVQQVIGFAVALVAVWFLSKGDLGHVHLPDLVLPVIAGLGFGFAFVCIDFFSEGSILWPLSVARVASILFLSVIALRQGQSLWPAPSALMWTLLAGIISAAAGGFFALATKHGRLDIAAVLGALYPAATVLLARFVLRERLNRLQWLGVSAALAAIVLIAAPNMIDLLFD